MIDPRWQGVRKVLAIRLDGAAGVVATGPALRALRRSLPRAEIVLMTSPAGARVAGCLPEVDDVVVYEAPWAPGNWHLSHDSDREQVMIRFLKSAHFDTAFVFSPPDENALLPAYMAYLADVPVRLGISAGAGSLLTGYLPHDSCPRHEVERALDLAAFAGFRTWNADLTVSVPVDDSVAASVALADAHAALPGLLGPTVAVYPGADAHPLLRDAELFARIADLLVERLGALVVLAGNESERGIIRHIRERMCSPAVTLPANLSFPAVCSVLQCADVTITGSPTGSAVCSGHVPVLWLSACEEESVRWGPWHARYESVDVRGPDSGDLDELAVPRAAVDAVEELLDSVPEPGFQFGEAGWMV